MYNLLEETGRIDTAWQVSPFWVGLFHCVGFIAVGLYNSTLLGCLVFGLVPPGGGFPTLDEPVGAIPHPYHHPKNKTNNIQNPTTDGATDETPTMKNPPPRDGKGVMSIT